MKYSNFPMMAHRSTALTVRGTLILRVDGLIGYDIAPYLSGMRVSKATRCIKIISSVVLNFLKFIFKFTSDVRIYLVQFLLGISRRWLLKDRTEHCETLFSVFVYLSHNATPLNSKR
jgi:hypothetical protein